MWEVQHVRHTELSLMVFSLIEGSPMCTSLIKMPISFATKSRCFFTRLLIQNGSEYSPIVMLHMCDHALMVCSTESKAVKFRTCLMSGIYVCGNFTTCMYRGQEKEESEAESLVRVQAVAVTHTLACRCSLAYG